MRLWLVVTVGLVGCGFRTHALTDAAGDGSAAVDAAIDSSVDGPAAPTSPRRLVIDSTASNTLSASRLYVSLDASTVDYAMVTDPTTQLRFHDETANVDLQFEVNRWNPAGESGVWVKLDSVPPGMLTSTMMYFGPSANGISKPEQVWGGRASSSTWSRGSRTRWASTSPEARSALAPAAASSAARSRSPAAATSSSTSPRRASSMRGRSSCSSSGSIPTTRR